ncbi:MAG TPA: hypothetical protein VN744_03550, partial [Casimicrobiaceae bacterium]|nr:hypothetical protein [Casimicrobiaceae bacterium]
MKNATLIAALVTAAVLLGGCSKAPDPPIAAPKPKTEAVATIAAPAAANGAEARHPGDGIAWQKGDVDAAFASAMAQNKPVFLYWGAVWCPP